MPLGQSQYIIPGRSFTAGYSYGYPLELKAKILGFNEGMGGGATFGCYD